MRRSGTGARGNSERMVPRPQRPPEGREVELRSLLGVDVVRRRPARV